MSRQTHQEKHPKRTRKKKPGPGEPYVVTRALTHIRLVEVNPGKFATLDALAPVYLDLCQHYVTLFCTIEPPDKLHAPCYCTPLSERWHRVAIMQAAGIAKSWRSNRTTAYQDYLHARAAYEAKRGDATSGKPRSEPTWSEWSVPTLREWCIQANVNVVVVEKSEDSTFDYWLRVSTLEKGKPLYVPVKLAPYQKALLTDSQTGEDKQLNTSVTLNKRDGAWWLTLTFDEEVRVMTPPDAPVVGIDVGIANFITTSTGKQYGTMHGQLRARHKRDREKCRRKAKLRACLKKKGVKKLPSTRSRTGQRLMRQTKQEINRAVNQCYADHPDAHFAYEQLSVASMRFKAKSMNAYLRAAHLAQIPRQIAWNATKRGIMATPVKSAYSSQECSVCHYTHRENRPDQKTFFCKVCGYSAHADINAATNISRRVGDKQLRACPDRNAIKALLLARHEQWKQQHGLEEMPPVKRGKRMRAPRSA